MRTRVILLLVMAGFSTQLLSQQAAGGGSSDQRRLRRCLEAGRSEKLCLSEGVSKSFKDTFLGGFDLGSLTGEPKPPAFGLRMAGVFEGSGPESVTLTFNLANAVLRCRDLAPETYAYGVTLGNGQALITVQTAPRPLVLTLRVDGRLVGPTVAEIAGKVQTGTEHGTRTWSDGRTEPISRPVYEARVRTCNASAMAASNTAANPAGLRLVGEYGSQDGFDLEFVPEGVVVGCGDVAILRQYSISGGLPVTLTVHHGDTPFSLVVDPAWNLKGAASVRVDGRQVTNVVDNRFTYAPRSASCNVGTLPPNTTGAVTAGVGASGPPPALGTPGTTGLRTGAGGNALLQVTATATTADGDVIPVENENFFLIDRDLDGVLVEAGFKAAPGKTALQTFAICRPGDPNCTKVAQTLRAHTVATAPSDEAGKVRFRGVAPGTYYLVGTTEYGGRPLVWNVKLDLRSGNSNITLTPANAAK